MHKAKSTDGKREKEPALEPAIADASGPEAASPSMESRTVPPAQDMKTNPQPPYGNSAPRNEGWMHHRRTGYSLTLAAAAHSYRGKDMENSQGCNNL